MTAALSLAFFVVGTLFVWLGQPFGPLAPGAPTLVGVVLFGAAVPLFLCRKPISLHISAEHPRRYGVVAGILLAAVAVWLVVVVRRFGPSPELYVLRRQVPPADVLLGQYRELLPLRAFWPPVMLSLAVSMVLVADARRRWLFIPVAALALIAFVSVYETRYMIIWLALYFLLHKVMHVRRILRLLTPRFVLGICAGAIAFMILGNIRTGVSLVDSQGFAEAMAVSPQYSRLPLAAIWALIYSFSGFARGIANDSFIHVVSFSVPDKLLPGVLQRVHVFANHITLSPRYGDQAFAIDAWHSYALQFGIIGAFLLTAVLFLTLHLVIRHVRHRVLETGSIGGFEYAVLLWMLVRITLLPIGDYFLDFGAFVELLALAALLKAGGVRLEPTNDEGAAVS